MADINDLANRVQTLGLGVTQDKKTADSELGQDEFFNLMITQLTNQDPLEPLDSSDFLTQVAQFSQLTGILDMARSVELLSSSLASTQALQASTLVGRTVSVPGTRLQIEAAGDTAGGAVVLPVASGDVRVSITTPSGARVRTIEMGALGGGETRFNWDGRTDSGEVAPPGFYSVRAEAQLDGAPVALETLVDTTVESVTLGRNASGMTLNLKGVGATSVNDVREIF